MRSKFKKPVRLIVRYQKIILFIITTMSITLSGITGWYLHKQQQRAIISEFQKDVSIQTLSLYRELDHSINALGLFSAGFNTQTALDYKSFSLNAERVLDTTRSIKLLAFIKQVNNSERLVIEHKQQILDPSFHILEQSQTNAMVTAKIRPEYFPIFYTFPVPQEVSIVGLDIGSDPAVLKALKAAAETKKVNATLTSLQSYPHDKLLLGIAPLYNKSVTINDINSSQPTEFMLALLNLKQIFNASVFSNNLANVDLKIIDNNASTPDKLLYHHNSSDTNSKLEVGLTSIVKLPDDYSSIDWSLVATPSESYLRVRQNKIPELAFLLGLVFSLVLSAYLRMMLKQTRIIERLVEKKTLELKLSNEQLIILNRTDALTGVANRRYLDTMLNHEWSRAIRNKSTISFIFIDIDFFKLYNDNYGHVSGDKCLKTVATTLAATLSRPADLCARYGGEEFAIILPETQQAEVVAEKCRRAIQNLGIVHKFSTTAEIVTISLGVCKIIPKVGSNPSTIIEYADHALYQAKITGKNKVVVIANPLD